MKINSNTLATTTQQNPNKLKNVRGGNHSSRRAAVGLITFYFTAI